MPPRRAFLLGEGVAHSLSPVMHTAAFAACGIDARYASWEVRREELDQAVARLRRDDCLGANITMPHKRAVVDRADVCSVAVRRCGAGNLLVNRQGRLHLDNTDVLALRTAFTRRARHLARGPVAVLGAGGAAAAVLEALRELDPPAVWVLARRPSAAARLVERDRGRLGGRPTVLPLAAAADSAGSATAPWWSTRPRSEWPPTTPARSPPSTCTPACWSTTWSTARAVPPRSSGRPRPAGAGSATA